MKVDNMNRIISILCTGLLLAGLQSAHGAEKLPKELKAIDKACQKGGADACLELAGRFSDGRGASRDDVLAAEYYRRACDAGSGDGCDLLGERYVYGRGVERSIPKAAELFDRGCRAGDGGGCLKLGQLLEV